MELFRQNKNTNKPIISQILDLVSKWIYYEEILEQGFKKN